MKGAKWKDYRHRARQKDNKNMVCHIAPSYSYRRKCNLKCVMSDWYTVAHDKFLDLESIDVLSGLENEYTESFKQKKPRREK